MKLLDTIFKARRKDDRTSKDYKSSDVVTYRLSEKELQEVIAKYGPPIEPLPKLTRSIAWGAKGRKNAKA